MIDNTYTGLFKDIIRLLKDSNKNKDNSTDYSETLNSINNNVESIVSNLKNSNFLNPSHLGIVTEGDTTFNQNVVLCNITNDNITVTITAANDSTAQSVTLTPGWNPVIVKRITGATANTLVYGW